MRERRLVTIPLTGLLCVSLAIAWGLARPPADAAPADPARSMPAVLPSLVPHLTAYYDFEHPIPGTEAQEEDQGFSGTNLDLVNGGAGMRVEDGAYPGSSRSMQTQQLNPTAMGNDDWKAGIYSSTGIATLNAFNRAREITVMGWFKMTGTNPAPTPPRPTRTTSSMRLDWRGSFPAIRRDTQCARCWRSST